MIAGATKRSQFLKTSSIKNALEKIIASFLTRVLSWKQRIDIVDEALFEKKLAKLSKAKFSEELSSACLEDSRLRLVKNFSKVAQNLWA